MITINIQSGKMTLNPIQLHLWESYIMYTWHDIMLDQQNM